MGNRSRKHKAGSGEGQRGEGPRDGSSGGGWYATHGRDIRFLVIFATLMAVYYLATLTSLVEQQFMPWYLELNARVSGAILNGLGYPVEVDGSTLVSTYTIQIRRGCDAVAPSALFVSAVLASPLPFRPRLLAALGGTFFLMTLNLVRIVSLFLIRGYAPSWFNVIHLDVWQAIFIFLAILLWAMWASRMARLRDGAVLHAA